MPLFSLAHLLAAPKVDSFASVSWGGRDTVIKTVHALALRNPYPVWQKNYFMPTNKDWLIVK